MGVRRKGRLDGEVRKDWFGGLGFGSIELLHKVLEMATSWSLRRWRRQWEIDEFVIRYTIRYIRCPTSRSVFT